MITARRCVKWGLGAVALTPGLWYAGLATPRQRTLTRDILGSLPVIVAHGGLGRFTRSLAHGLVISVDYKWHLRGLDETSQAYADALAQSHLRSARRLLRGCLANGGLYIKFGQGLVSMNHVLPREYLDTLCVLQDQCLTRRSEDEVDEIFEADLGRRPDEVFKRFERQPLAAASLAQVFLAETHEGQSVAVKVQYIDLRDKFQSDVPTMECILKLIEIMHAKFAFAWILNELRDTLAQELDFEAEARNAERCARDLAALPYVYVPQVLWPQTSRRILTMEFIQGIKISESEQLRAAHFDLADIDRKLIGAFAHQIFHTGFVHADPHPGNLLIRPSPRHGGPEIVILDHGLYQALPTQSRTALARVWQAVVENDHAAMKTHSQLLGVDDYRLFCMALSQRYIAPTAEERASDPISQLLDQNGPKAFSRKRYNQLPEEEKARLRLVIGDFHDRMFDVFQKIPSHMVLVFRNLNTIRAIIKEHETEVDRYQIMARSATKGAFVAHSGSGLSGFVLGHWFQLLFDFRLLCDSVTMTCMSVLLRAVKWLGMMPDVAEMESDQDLPIQSKPLIQSKPHDE